MDELRLETKAEQGNQIEYISLACGGYTLFAASPALAYSPVDGRPHASFYDQTRKALMYLEATEMERNAPVWSTPYKVDPPDAADGSQCPQGEGIHGTGQWNALAVDREGKPHIVYYEDFSRLLKYAWATSRKEDGTWNFQRAYLDIHASNVGKWVSATLDDSTPQRIHVVYEDSEASKIKYITWDREENPGACPPKIETGADTCPDILGYVLDAGGFPGFPETGKPLGGTSTAIGLSGADALNAPNTLYAAYHSESDGDLRLAFKGAKEPRDAAWKVVVLDDIPEPKSLPKEGEDFLWDISPENVGYWPSLAVDSDGNVHIAYFDLSKKDLKYVMFEASSGEWFPRLKSVQNFDARAAQTILETAPTAPGELPREFVLQEQQLQFISGIGRQTTEMWIGSVNGIGNVVDDGSGIGAGLVSSIAIGPGNTPIISYKDGGTGELKVAVYAPDVSVPWGRTWGRAVLLKPDQAGSRSSLVTLPAETPEGWKIGLMYETFEAADGNSIPKVLYQDLSSTGAMQPLLQAGTQVR